jgi:two-component system NtrC family sensor kinase
MASLPTLRRELVTALALVFAGALLLFVIGVLFLLPRGTEAGSFAYFGLLSLAVVGLFALFGHLLIQRLVLVPIRDMVAQVETIAAGEFDRRLAETGPQELSRLSAAVNHVAERLIRDQAQLAANIQSLDETNRMLTEARDAMVRAEKMASVGRLSAGIAHEIGNPLGAILGYLGLLRRGAEGSTLEMIVAAERESNRIDRIVRGLLDYARARESRLLAMDVNRVVRDTVDLLETQGKLSRIDMDIDLSDSVPPVMGDPYQLQQVLVNLLVNAVDALADTETPRIDVHTRVRPWQQQRRLPARRKDDPPGVDYSHRRRLARVAGPTLDPVAVSSGQVVEIAVADNGNGIPDDLIDQIFEPFVTTKDPGKGTGLGLAVSARLVETMGGIMRAESVTGGGSTFIVVLPAGERTVAQEGE